ncbi:Hypothetical protein C900_04035 [Fulvivirga imtechensis AK7]|uniref:Zinc finger CGNR domain-containing protein n=1 Tax=Fulvivirga imtechensis AK7 TaxID=1237149 RepID=L8JNF1_9BACT|nr:CGNR zinc finger domain-containing protein [Fulvivirga imtechensis]ELR70350.1 Hypothetical protein C900_04035 [Fulvivirga imtechensis AK7]
MAQKKSIENISLHGGWLCLDFINTVHDWTVDQPYDYLSSYEAVLKWSKRLKVLPEDDINALREKYEQDREAGEQVLDQMNKARKVLHELFLVVIRNSPIAEDIKKQFNKLLGSALSNLQIMVDGSILPQEYWDGMDLEKPLYPVMKSAYDLLMSDRLSRVKECGACGWLFLDKSKNNSRRWCDMQACGSTVKAKRYYRKKKEMDKEL